MYYERYSSKLDLRVLSDVPLDFLFSALRASLRLFISLPLCLLTVVLLPTQR
jgi:hypothetical protein